MVPKGKYILERSFMNFLGSKLSLVIALLLMLAVSGLYFYAAATGANNVGEASTTTKSYELQNKSTLHALLIPVYFECRNDFFWNSTQPVTCLVQVAEAARQIGISGADFTILRNDIIAYEGISK